MNNGSFSLLSIDGPRPSSSWLLSSSVSFGPTLHSNLFLILITPVRLRSLSNNIMVDSMATEKIEGTENLTSYAMNDIS